MVDKRGTEGVENSCLSYNKLSQEIEDCLRGCGSKEDCGHRSEKIGFIEFNCEYCGTRKIKKDGQSICPNCYERAKASLISIISIVLLVGLIW